MDPHDSIASISAIIMAIIMGVCIFLIVTRCEAWTGHEFEARLTRGNDWKITSLPEAVDNSEKYDMASRLGYLSYVFAVKEDGKWDNEIMFMGPIAAGSEKGRKWAKTKIGVMMKAVDKVLSSEKIIVILFLPDYGEMSAFFSPERWKDENFHREAARKLNIEREKWRKQIITG
jgi:hypothetical protein